MRTVTNGTVIVEGQNVGYSAEKILFPTANVHGQFHTFLVVVPGLKSFYTDSIAQAESDIAAAMSDQDHPLHVGS